MLDRNFSYELAPLIHQAALDPHLSNEMLNDICDTSRHYKFSGLCTCPTLLKTARERLGSPKETKLICVIAFPFGFIPHNLKRSEAEWAAENGAEELDVVPNYHALSKGETNIFATELAEICETGLSVTAILDMVNLSQEKIVIAVEAAIDAGVHCIQTGNGFGRGVNKFDIEKLSKLTRNQCEIKAVGGIKTANQAFDLIDAGATKLGTSCGYQLIKNNHEQTK